MERKFFLAHSSADREFVTWLASQLIARRIPLWYSDWEIKVGDSITEKIDAAIAQMEGLLVVLSRSSLASTWVREELNAGLARHLDGQHIRIFPIRLDESTVPPLLAHRRYADFTGDREKALRDLMEALVPSGNLVAEIRGLKAECRGLLNLISCSSPDRPDFRLILGPINALLERAVEARYAIEIRREPTEPPAPAGFFEQFDYLVRRGYDLRNPDWGMVVMLRNIYAHEMNQLLAVLEIGADRARAEPSGTRKEFLFAIDRIEEIFDSLLQNTPAEPISAQGGG